MTPEQILATIAALLAGPNDGAFETLKNGAFDPAYPVTIEACPTPKPLLDVEGQTVICGRVNVPENHHKPDGNRIDLAFAVLAARSLAPAPDPVIYLHGGPGGTAVSDLAFNAGNFDAFRDRRDVIFFDQRASGISAQTVNCTMTRAATLFASEEAALAAAAKAGDAEAFNPFASLGDCLAEVAESGVVLADYSTKQNARDVRAVMSALGYPVYNAYGISYGTKLGQELMRIAPEGLRAVVLDSIAPVDVPSYDGNGNPLDQAVGAVVDLCAADPACAEAFPDLEATFAAAAARLEADPIPATATRPEITLESFIHLFEDRNVHGLRPGVTAYIPLIAAGLAQGDPTAFDLVGNGVPPPVVSPELLVTTYIGGVDHDVLAIAYAAAQSATGLDGQLKAIETMLRQIGTDTSTGPGFSDIELLLDTELSAAVLGLNPTEAIAMGRDYASLLAEPRSRDAVIRWATAHVPEPHLARVINLLNVMSGADLAVFYDRAVRDTATQTPWAGQMFDTAIYACQESIPFNSREGFDTALDQLRFPWLRQYAYDDTSLFYDICDAFAPVDHTGFHEPFDTDIPVLALSGLLDTQTNPDAAEHMATMLSNARAVTFPESGHGTILFSQCALDIAVGFIEDPEAPINAGCVDALVPDFVTP